MALTEFQRGVCKLIAANRSGRGESYVAGGIALNELLGAPRLSRDIDIFHDAKDAVDAAWQADRALLTGEGFAVSLVRERPAFIEALISRESGSVLMQWAQDSAYRFFPLLPNDDFGLVLHPFDLATNKVLALVGRLEPRDWIDVIECDRRLQPLGYLAWAASAKDPGFSPEAILAEAARTARYSNEEVQELSFEGEMPDARALSRAWHRSLDEANTIVAALPVEQVGRCVLTLRGDLYTGGAATIPQALREGQILFHTGSLFGALPRIVGA